LQDIQLAIVSQRVCEPFYNPPRWSESALGPRTARAVRWSSCAILLRPARQACAARMPAPLYRGRQRGEGGVAFLSAPVVRRGRSSFPRCILTIDGEGEATASSAS